MDFFFMKIYVGNTIEHAWPGAGSSQLKCISIANTSFEK